MPITLEPEGRRFNLALIADAAALVDRGYDCDRPVDCRATNCLMGNSALRGFN